MEQLDICYSRVSSAAQNLDLQHSAAKRYLELKAKAKAIEVSKKVEKCFN